jgi:hypothetical protein
MDVNKLRKEGGWERHYVSGIYGVNREKVVRIIGKEGRGSLYLKE